MFHVVTPALPKKQGSVHRRCSTSKLLRDIRCSRAVSPSGDVTDRSNSCVCTPGSSRSYDLPRLSMADKETLISPRNRYGSYAAPSSGALDDLLDINMAPVYTTEGQDSTTGASSAENKLFRSGRREESIISLDPVQAWKSHDRCISTGNKPIMVAAEQNNVSLIKLLLHRGNHYCVANDDGETLLEVAARHDHHDVIETIMDFVKETKGQSGLRQFLEYRARSTKTAAIHYAMRNNNPETVRLLAEANTDVLSMLGANGMNAIHYGARKNAVAALTVFLSLAEKEGILEDVLHAQTTAGLTPLHSATSGSHLETVKLLLKHKADPFLSDSRGETCFFAPVATDDKTFLRDVIEWMEAHMRRADIHNSYQMFRVCNNQGHTILHRAVSTGAKQCVEFLVEKDPELLLEGFSELPVHTAVKCSHSSQLAFLIQKTLEVRGRQSRRRSDREAVPTSQCLLDSKKRSLVHLAALVGDRQSLEVILKLSKEDWQIAKAVGCELSYDRDGCTPLFYIAWSGKIEGLEAFVSVGENEAASWISVENMLTATTDGRSVFYIAARNGHPQVLKRFLQLLESRLKEQAIPIDCFMRPDNKAGLTPLHIAALHNRRRCLQLLLDARANCSLDHFHRSPLHYAACKGYKGVCGELLDYQPQCLNWKDLQDIAEEDRFAQPEAGTGKTALHYAAEFGHGSVVDLLLDKDADIMQDRNSCTALDLAISNLQEDVVRVIFKHHRWEEMLEKSDYHNVCEILISDMPDLAKDLLDNFYFVEGDLKRRDCEVVYHLDYLYYTFQPPAGTLPHASQGDADSIIGKAVTHGRRDTYAEIDEGAAEEKELWHMMKKQMRDASRSGHTHDCENGRQVSGCFGPECLVSLIVDKGQQQLLLHPVVKAWTHKKWHGYVFKVHIVNLFLYILYLLSLTMMVVNVRPYERCPEFYRFNEYKSYERSSAGVQAAAILVQIFAVVNLLKEILQLIKLGVAKYCTDVDNLLDWMSYIFAFCFALDLGNPPGKGQWLVGAIAIFLSWINLILFFQKMTFFGIHVVMFLQILKSVIKALFVFALFVFAFGFAFYILMSESPNFTTVGESLMMVIAMAVGMISIPANFFHLPVTAAIINGTCSDPGNPSSTTVILGGNELTLLNKAYTWFFLLVFVITAPVILMNMLIGLAVGDIALVREKASEKIAAMQADLILSLEAKLPMWFLKRYANFVVYRKKPNEKKAWYLKLYTALTSIGKWNLISDHHAVDSSIESSANRLDEKFDRLSAQQRMVIEQVQSLSKVAEQTSLQQHHQGDQVQELTKSVERLFQQQTLLLQQLRRS